jgi:antitoxin component of RelBE/YafQ-DinJ toxin-antitoxin module
MNPGDAVNLLMAQIELHQGIPFDVSLQKGELLSASEQARIWTEALGEY